MMMMRSFQNSKFQPWTSMIFFIENFTKKCDLVIFEIPWDVNELISCSCFIFTTHSLWCLQLPVSIKKFIELMKNVKTEL